MRACQWFGADRLSGTVRGKPLLPRIRGTYRVCTFPCDGVRELHFFFFLRIGRPPRSPLFPYPTLFRSPLNHSSPSRRHRSSGQNPPPPAYTSVKSRHRYPHTTPQPHYNAATDTSEPG